MLKAYDFSERPMDNKMHESGLFNKEKRIAMDFVLEHPQKNNLCSCAICKSKNTRFIFERWDVNYYLCQDCGSLYIPTDSKTINAYIKLDEMADFRKSDEYQNQAANARGAAWDDFISWLKYRSYRYLGKNKSLKVIDYGNKYAGLVSRLMQSELCANYELRDSILDIKTDTVENADILIYLNQLQHEITPIESLKIMRNDIKDDGILVINTRLGSGFDILTLKGGIQDIFPYEHITLPSKKGLEIILNEAGFELLEITTPGTRDMNVVIENKERIDDGNFFIKYLLEVADDKALRDFQQLLQKMFLSSFAQVIARKKERCDEKN